MPNNPSLPRNIFFIGNQEPDYGLFKEALMAVDPAIALYYLPGCDYSHFGEGYFVPDLIVLELARGNCWTCLQKIRSSSYVAVPVIVYAPGCSYPEMERAYRRGASLYVVKPPTYALLLRCLERLLREVNWQDPAQLTGTHFQKGKYLPFAVK